MFDVGELSASTLGDYGNYIVKAKTTAFQGRLVPMHNDTTFANFRNHRKQWSMTMPTHVEEKLRLCGLHAKECKEFVLIFRGFLDPGDVELVPPEPSDINPQTHTPEWHEAVKAKFRASLRAAWADRRFQTTDEIASWLTINAHAMIALKEARSHPII